MPNYKSECLAIQKRFLAVRSLIFQRAGINAFNQVYIDMPHVTAPAVCLDIATRYHYGQLDKAGRNYIEHPKTVAANFRDTNLICVALLHDVLEDTPCTATQLLQFGVDSYIVHAVVAITRPSGMTYADYLAHAAANPLAVWVKLADLSHNMDLSRLSVFDAKVLKRCNKYYDAIVYLARTVWGCNV